MRTKETKNYLVKPYMDWFFTASIQLDPIFSYETTVDTMEVLDVLGATSSVIFTSPEPLAVGMRVGAEDRASLREDSALISFPLDSSD